MWLPQLLRKIDRHFLRYEPSIKIFISQTRLLKNLREYQTTYPHLLFAPVLKSNAYGHGLVEVARILDRQNLPFLVVDSLPEAAILRRNGIKSEILVIGHVKPENINHSRLSNVSFTVTGFEQLAELSRIISSDQKIHLKIDTGMRRQGIRENQLDESVRIIKSNSFFNLTGACSHFADADNPDQSFTRLQIRNWNQVALKLKREFPSLKYFHIAATAGTFFSRQAFGNVARLGIGLYGINPSPFARLKLQPVLQMRSIVSSLRTLKKGERVGYNLTYKAKRDSIIATVPVGYFEGVDRRLSNRGFFKINHTFCPLVGRVSMNITSVDVTSVPGIKTGDDVVIISDETDDLNSVVNIAKLAQTIPWEILVHLPAHLRRVVV